MILQLNLIHKNIHLFLRISEHLHFAKKLLEQNDTYFVNNLDTEVRD